MEDLDPARDGSIAAVAASAGRAQALASQLWDAGVSARPCTDLDDALTPGTSLVVIDPQGWEDSCRTNLEAFEIRKEPPPAVILTSADPLVVYCAGPAWAFLPQPLEPRTTAVQVARALKARERFCSFWPAPLATPRPSDLKRIEPLVEKAAGLAIRPDRRAVFLEALRIRMVAKLVPTAREYAGLLERPGEGEGEIELLAGLLSVGETYFWRYSGQYRALQTWLLPVLTRNSRPERLHLWSAGCASGEEPYSLAMACSEVLDSAQEFSVVGTDIHRPSLSRAGQGIYRSRSLRNLPPALAQKYTEPVPGQPRQRRVSEALRRRVRFEPLNLGQDGLADWARAHGPFHAIFCRNTLIYFSRSAVERVLAVFESALVPGGGLFLGASEAIYPPRPALRPVRALGSIFFVREAPPKVAPAIPAQARGNAGEPDPAARYAHGLGLLEAEDLQGARDVFQSLVTVAPEDARGHAGLALLLANEGREAEAQRCLQRAEARTPELAETHYLLGLLEERSGREAEALLRYRRALVVDPGFFLAHFNRGWVFRRMGREDAFRDEMRQALSILKTKPRAAPWLTGGLGPEALLGLVAEALGGEGGAS